MRWPLIHFASSLKSKLHNLGGSDYHLNGTDDSSRNQGGHDSVVVSEKQTFNYTDN